MLNLPTCHFLQRQKGGLRNRAQWADKAEFPFCHPSLTSADIPHGVKRWHWRDSLNGQDRNGRSGTFKHGSPVRLNSVLAAVDWV
jgi:hypothetical protein